VKIETSRGDIVVELFEDDAKNTVANFISLVEKRFYDGTVFHRVGAWVAQGGDPLACGLGGPEYTIKSEPSDRPHLPGYMGMARSEMDTEGSQFYFVKTRQPSLDAQQLTVFGRIIEGMDVMNSLRQGDKIISAVVIRKRAHDYKPVKTSDFNTGE
jgi:cyclophilin family peptidyl-prolyl cis-trans isomerase